MMHHKGIPTGSAPGCGGAKDRLRGVLLFATCLAGLMGCAQVREPQALPAIQDEMQQATRTPKAAPLPPAVEAALAPSVKLALPREAARSIEPRFDLMVSNAPATQVFMGVVSGTRYSMLLAPEVAGSITVNLKDVTVPEAMEAIRELYGYDYRIDGSRIFVQPLTQQTRFYTIPYLPGVRQGASEVRVTSGAITDAPRQSSTPGTAVPATTTTGSQSAGLQTSRLSTQTNADFWSELQASVGLLIGCGTTAGRGAGDGSAPPAPTCPEGRNVVVSPHTGMLAVRALPAEHRSINDYLKAARLIVERQVMIEAKIIEVTLNEGAQTGVNWARFHDSGKHGISKGADASLLPVPSATPSTTLGDLLGAGLSGVTGAANGAFGLAFQTGNFSVLLNFLETQGSVQVLSSPRIAVINNQKALLKVGTDEFFVTNVTTTTTTGTATTTTPSVTLQPFFSGIALDVTPQIDEHDNVILHVHPSVSQVTTVEKTIDLGGTGITSMTLPLASSNVSETDSIVRLRDGQIAAIGGLMKRESRDAGNQVPKVGQVPLLGSLFKNTNASRLKHELVILLKPTIIKQPGDWLDSARESATRLGEMAVQPQTNGLVDTRRP